MLLSVNYISSKKKSGKMDVQQIKSNKHASCTLIWVIGLTIMTTPLIFAYAVYTYAVTRMSDQPDEDGVKAITELVKGKGGGWVNAFIDGSISFFGWTVNVATVVFITLCVCVRAKYDRWEVPVTPRFTRMQWVGSGIGLFLLQWVNILLQIYSDRNEWI